MLIDWVGVKWMNLNWFYHLFMMLFLVLWCSLYKRNQILSLITLKSLFWGDIILTNIRYLMYFTVRARTNQVRKFDYIWFLKVIGSLEVQHLQFLLFMILLKRRSQYVFCLIKMVESFISKQSKIRPNLNRNERWVGFLRLQYLKDEFFAFLYHLRKY